MVNTGKTYVTASLVPPSLALTSHPLNIHQNPLGSIMKNTSYEMPATELSLRLRGRARRPPMTTWILFKLPSDKHQLLSSNSPIAPPSLPLWECMSRQASTESPVYQGVLHSTMNHASSTLDVFTYYSHSIFPTRGSASTVRRIAREKHPIPRARPFSPAEPSRS